MKQYGVQMKDTIDGSFERYMTDRDMSLHSAIEMRDSLNSSVRQRFGEDTPDVARLVSREVSDWQPVEESDGG